jgi:hypothetical protein
MISPRRTNSSIPIGPAGTILSQSDPTLTIALPPSRDRPAGDGALNESADRNSLADAADSAAPGGDRGDGNAHASGDQPNAGGGLAVTLAPRPRLEAIPLSAQGNPGQQGTAAGGGVGTGAGQTPGIVGGESDASNQPVSIPPWQTTAWPAAQAAAIQSIRNNQINPTYQDLVRDYFQRP